jgi:signal transduction histidine kinase
MLSITI